MSLRTTVESAYERWNARDWDGMLALFPDNAVFAIPGRTRISGDHDKVAFRSVLAQLAAAAGRGDYRAELVCLYESAGGVVAVFDNYVAGDPLAEKYHAIHEWIFRDGRLRAFMLYVHEYDVFARAWV